jgi:hypothetical protein
MMAWKRSRCSWTPDLELLDDCLKSISFLLSVAENFDALCIVCVLLLQMSYPGLQSLEIAIPADLEDEKVVGAVVIDIAEISTVLDWPMW